MRNWISTAEVGKDIQKAIMYALDKHGVGIYLSESDFRVDENGQFELCLMSGCDTYNDDYTAGEDTAEAAQVTTAIEAIGLELVFLSGPGWSGYSEYKHYPGDIRTATVKIGRFKA